MMRPERASVRFAKENSRRNCAQRLFRFSISCCCCNCCCCQLDTKISSRNSICRGRSEARSCCCCFFYLFNKISVAPWRILIAHSAKYFQIMWQLGSHTHAHTRVWVCVPLPLCLSFCLPASCVLLSLSFFVACTNKSPTIEFACPTVSYPPSPLSVCPPACFLMTHRHSLTSPTYQIVVLFI